MERNLMWIMNRKTCSSCRLKMQPVFLVKYPSKSAWKARWLQRNTEKTAAVPNARLREENIQKRTDQLREMKQKKEREQQAKLMIDLSNPLALLRYKQKEKITRICAHLKKG